MAVTMSKTVKSLRNARLRAEAGLLYVGHPIGISIEELHKDPRFSELSVRTLFRWAQVDRWVERRVSFIEEWKAEARKRLAGQLAQARLDELDLLAEIASSGLQKIREDAVAPKSLEGLMRATVEALKYKDELRQRIGETVIEEAGSTNTVAKELPKDMTEEAAAAAARAALVARRQGPPMASLPAPMVVDIGDAIGDLEDEVVDLRSETSDLGEGGGGEDSAGSDYGTSNEG